MENNNLNGQPVQPVQPAQPVYQQPVQVQPVYQQPAQPVQPVYQAQPQYQPAMNVDANATATIDALFKSAILNVIFCSFPVGSIICMITAGKERKKVDEFLASGGPHTGKLKTAAALLTVAKKVGLGFTIFWAVYFVWIFFAIILAAAGSLN